MCVVVVVVVCVAVVQCCFSIVWLGLLPMLCLTSISIQSLDTDGDSDGDDAETDGETEDEMDVRMGIDVEDMMMRCHSVRQIS